MEEKKKGHGLVIALVIIIVLLIALLAVVTTLLVTSKTKNEVKKPQPTQQEEKYVDLAKDDALVTEASSLIPIYMCGGLALDLKNEDVTIDDLPNSEKLNMVISLHLDDLFKTSADLSSFTFKEEELTKYFADLKFMDEFKPGIDTGTNGDGTPQHAGTKYYDDTIYPLYMTYKDGVYTMGGYGTGCTAPGNPGYGLMLENAKKSDSNLVLNYARYYSEPEMDESTGNFYYNYFNHKGDKEAVAKIVDLEKDPEKVDTKKLDHFEFVYNIKNDKLILEKINYKES